MDKFASRSLKMTLVYNSPKWKMTNRKHRMKWFMSSFLLVALFKLLSYQSRKNMFCLKNNRFWSIVYQVDEGASFQEFFQCHKSFLSNIFWRRRQLSTFKFFLITNIKTAYLCNIMVVMNRTTSAPKSVLRYVKDSFGVLFKA